MPDTITIGELRQLVKWEVNDPIERESGGDMPNYVPLLTCAGSLRKKSGNRFLDAGEVVQGNSYELWVRYQSAIANVLDGEEIRLIVDNRKFVITSSELVEQRTRFYRLQLRGKE